MSLRPITYTLLLCALPLGLPGQIAVDGVVEPSYGGPVSVDSTLPQGNEGGPDRSPHLDLAELHVTDDGQDLFVAVTVAGDVRSQDWVKFIVLIDSPALPGRDSRCAWDRAMTARSNYQASFWVSTGGGADFHRWSADARAWENLGPSGGAGVVGLSATSTILECRIPLRELGDPGVVQLAVCSTGSDTKNPALDVIPASNGNGTSWDAPTTIGEMVTYQVGKTGTASKPRSRAEWSRSYHQGRELSSAERRPMIVYFGRQDEERCKQIQQGILLGAPFNEKAKDFVCVYQDVTKSGPVASSLGVMRVPHIILFDQTGKPVAEFSRDIEADGLLRQMDLLVGGQESASLR